MNNYGMSDEITGLGALSRRSIVSKARVNAAHKAKMQASLSAEGVGLGMNFWDSLKETATKVTNIGKEIKKGADVAKEIGILVKRPKTLTQTQPPNGLPTGSSDLEPAIKGMTATDEKSKTTAVPTDYLLYGALAAATGLLIYVVARK